MLVFLMTGNADNDVTVFARDDGYFVAVFIAFVVFAFRNHISMGFVQGINFAFVFGLLCPTPAYKRPLIKQEVWSVGFKQSVLG